MFEPSDKVECINPGRHEELKLGGKYTVKEIGDMEAVILHRKEQDYCPDRFVLVGG